MRKNFYKVLIVIVLAVTSLRFFIQHYGVSNTIALHEREADVFTASSLLSTTEQPQPVCKENISAQSSPDFENEPQNMKDFLTYRHCKYFPQLLDSPMKCGGPAASKEVFLLLAIKSSPANYERREAVRKTWGLEKMYSGVHVKRIFLCGIPKPQKEDTRMMQLLTIEKQMYNDILQWNFYDTFYNLTLKQVLFHEWLEKKCPGAQFVFNGDDDVFVNTFNMISYLQSLGKDGGDHHLFAGALNIGMPPVRESYSKYYVPASMFPGNSFAPYCGGGGIIMSGFTARSIYNASQHIPLFPIDDAYLGMCLELAGLKPENHEGIRTFGINLPVVDSFHPCYYKDMLMVHRFVPYEMLVMWKALQVTELKCRRKAVVTSVKN
ncbi:acetylgalactosaminyl-O-glycosyl-glycoprotein beta-1,3-N-acetylglucosaminyltransferase-like [Rhinophrynus dorsalis]